MESNILYLTLPLIISGIIHMIIVRLNLFSSLSRPINSDLFGQNKTWRGMLVMPLATLLSIHLLTPIVPFKQFFTMTTVNLSILGLLLGFAYVLFELPNSWFKRRCGIAPGEQATQNRTFFFLLDRLDSVTGCTLVYYIFLHDLAVFMLIPLAIIIHPLITIPLFFLNIKKKLL